ncbi:histone-lysine N-methyltransferase ATX2 isoform X1, partial [Tanacetum coccineum]
VHARCYEELEPIDGVLWLCNLCRPGAPEVSPPCCLCPVTGGAMKPTTDGRLILHVLCGYQDRWKLLCSIYGVPYGACIQCSNNACYVAYHPLCSRTVGFFAELANVDRLQVVPLDEDEENQCIRLLSFCKRHSPNRSTERVAPDERIGQLPSHVLRASEGLVDAPADQNLRPTGHMRGSLMGCVYSDALSQKIILPTEPVQPASQPVPNIRRPALAPHLQVLPARNGNVHGYLDGASGM